MSTKLGKKSDNPIFKQIIDLIPSGLFRKCVSKYKSDKGCSRYYTYDQLVSTMFGQLNRCLSLREISLGIDQSPEFLADMIIYKLCTVLMRISPVLRCASRRTAFLQSVMVEPRRYARLEKDCWSRTNT